MASTVGSLAACSRNACTLVANDSYGWCSRTSCCAMDAKMSGRRVRLGRQQVDARRRHVLGVLQHGPVDLDHLEQAAEVERSRQPVHLLLGDVELAHEQAERQVVHVVGDLEPDRRPEPASQQFALERLDEVLGLVLLDLDVLVAGDPELVVLEHLHAGEEVVEVVGDEVLERDEPQQPAVVIRQLHEPRQHRRHLEPGELLLARLRAAHPDREVERQSGDVGERMRRVDRERHQHREDLAGEDLVDAVPVGLVEVGPGRRCGCRPRRGPASPGRGTPRRAAPAARAPSR